MNLTLVLMCRIPRVISFPLSKVSVTSTVSVATTTGHITRAARVVAVAAAFKTGADLAPGAALTHLVGARAAPTHLSPSTSITRSAKMQKLRTRKSQRSRTS